MSFLNLLDHTVDVVRPAMPVADDSLGDERETYSAVFTAAKAAFWPLHAPINDYGAGETPTGDTQVFMESTVTPQDRDILVTLTGPETGKRWRVTANRSPGARFGQAAHHRELICEQFEGTLPGYDP